MSNNPIHQKEFSNSYDHNTCQLSLERRNNDSSISKEFTLRDILERWVGSEETLRTIMIAKAEEDRLKQEMVRLDIKKMENEILINALRGGVQPNAIPIIFSGQQLNSSTLALSQSYSLSSTSSVQYQSRNLGSSDISISALCHTSQEPGSLSNQCILQSRPQTKILNTLDSFPTNSPCQKNEKSPFMLSKNIAEPVPNQNHTLNPNTSLPSLFFHYWVPPGESVNPTPSINSEGHDPAASSQPNVLNLHEKEQSSFSPSKKKRVSQSQQFLLPPFGNSVLPPLSKRSPRHHLRHRSETSVLQSKFFDTPSNKSTNSPITIENSIQDSKTLIDKS